LIGFLFAAFPASERSMVRKVRRSANPDDENPDRQFFPKVLPLTQAGSSSAWEGRQRRIAAALLLSFGPVRSSSAQNSEMVIFDGAQTVRIEANTTNAGCRCRHTRRSRHRLRAYIGWCRHSCRP
jgi:hypothetical protein